MFLVVHGVSHQSYGVWQPLQTMSQRDLPLNTNAELSPEGNLAMFLSVLIHSVMTQTQKNWITYTVSMVLFQRCPIAVLQLNSEVAVFFFSALCELVLPVCYISVVKIVLQNQKWIIAHNEDCSLSFTHTPLPTVYPARHWPNHWEQVGVQYLDNVLLFLQCNSIAFFHWTVPPK